MDFSKKTSCDINGIFRKRENGADKDYNTLYSILTACNANVPEFSNNEVFFLSVIKQLHLIATKLNSSHLPLVTEILKLKKKSFSETFNSEYDSFVLDLLSAHPNLYLNIFLDVIFKSFSIDLDYDSTMSLETMNEEDKTKEEHIFQKSHNLLQQVIKIVPSSVLILKKFLLDCYPSYQALHTQECYIQNLLKITEYIPSLRSYILEMIVSQLIVLDSECPREEILKSEEEEEDEHVVAMTADMEGLDKKEVKKDGLMKMRCARILDCLMKLMFKYMERHCFQNGELVTDIAKKMYIDVMKSFNSLLLKTFKTCHVQFLQFYLCSFKLDYAVDFIKVLWTKVISPNEEMMYRQLAASYLGSFLSRAKILPMEVVIPQLEIMNQWIHMYIKSVTSHIPSAIIHGPFYFVCQAFFYVIVFRHNDIFNTPAGKERCRSWSLQGIAWCQLNPFKFCMPGIVESFCSIVRNNRLAFCDEPLERNRRQTTLDSNDETSKSFFISYFPFDPYILFRSKEFIQPYYLNYDNSVIVNNVNREDSFNVQNDMEYMETETDNHEISLHPDMKYLPSLFGFSLYSSSPGF